MRGDFGAELGSRLYIRRLALNNLNFPSQISEGKVATQIIQQQEEQIGLNENTERVCCSVEQTCVASTLNFSRQERSVQVFWGRASQRQ